MTEKYELIYAEKANYPIVKMCEWIAVSRSGFYDWQARRAAGPNAAARRRSRLARLIRRRSTPPAAPTAPVGSWWCCATAGNASRPGWSAS